MAKASPLQGDFSGGEITPLAYGHVGSEKYRKSAGKLLNYVPIPQGAALHRSGSYYVNNAKNSFLPPRLHDFKYSTEQAYILELSDSSYTIGWGSARFYRNHGIIKAVDASGNPNSAAWNSGTTYPINALVLYGGVTYRAANLGVGLNQNKIPSAEPLFWHPFENHIYEILTPFPGLYVKETEFAQSADVLYFAHEYLPPGKFLRYSHTDWRLQAINFIDGPYLNINGTTTQITVTGPTLGVYLFEANFVNGINNDTGFQTTDVGRKIRIKNGTTWASGYITNRINTLKVEVALVIGTFPAAATKDWRLGLWSATTGYPSSVAFHEDRLFYGGTRTYQQRVDGSMTGDYENFTPSEASTGSTEATNLAVAYTLNSNDVNKIHWMRSHEKGLVAGTPGGEWVVRPASTGESLNNKNVNAKQVTNYGSARISPLLVGSSVVFVQGSKRRLRALTHQIETTDKFVAPDFTLGFEHLLKKGVVKLIRQREPFEIIWAILEDGRIIGCSHSEDLTSLNVAGSQHILGGLGYLGVSNAKVKDGACIPVADGSREEVWLCVEREVNGVIVRQIEYFNKFFDEEDNQRDAFFLDAGLTYDNPLNVVSFINNDPVEVFYTAHGLITGDKVRINTDFELSELDDKIFTVTRIDADNFSIDGVDGGLIQNNLYGAEIRKLVTVIGGLGHLEGQEVGVLTDGSVHPNRIVSGGEITLEYGAALVHVGYKRNADGQLLRQEAGSQDGTALGKKRRTHETGILVHRSLNLLLGMNFEKMDRVIFRATDDPMTEAPPLYSGIITENIEADYDTENLISWRQDQPLPSTILAVMPQVFTQDKG